MSDGDALSPELPPQSRAAWVLTRLREEILSGAIPPDTRLLSKDLTARYGVSATPMREAIQRLTAEGLVRSTPQHGATTAALDLQELRELFELRLLLEPQAVQRSIERAGDARLAEIERLLARNHELGARRDYHSEYWATHKALHAATRADCDSRWLARLVDLLITHCERYQRLRIQPGLTHHEHAALAKACRQRNGEAAAEATRGEVANTMEAVLSMLAEHHADDGAARSE